MTRLSRSRRAIAASISLLLLTPLGLLATSTAADAHTVAGAAVPTAEPPAGGHRGRLPLLQVPAARCAPAWASTSPPHRTSRARDCGFANFTLSGAADAVEAKLVRRRVGHPFATLDAVEDSQTPGDYQVDLAPTTTWPAGIVTMRVLADGEPAGETTFGHNLLQVDLRRDHRHRGAR